MPETGRSGDDPLLPIRDMMDFCQNITDHTAGIHKPAFVPTSVTYKAILWNIALIGEAANNAPDSIKAAHPEIQWRAIVDTRSRIIHQYWKIDSDVIWDIVQDDVPILLSQLRAIIA